MPEIPADLYIETHYKDQITTVADGDEEIGRVIVRDRLNNRPAYMYVYGLFVDEEHRHRGAGTTLMRHILGVYGQYRLELVGGLPGTALARWLEIFGFTHGPSVSGRVRASDDHRMYRPPDPS